MKNTKLYLLLGVILANLFVTKSYADDITQIKEFTNIDISDKIVQEGWGNSVDTVIILNSKAVIDGILSTPLSSIYNAPVLLTDSDNLPTTTQEQLTKLKPKNIILIGGENIVSNNVKETIQSILESVNIERIGGIDRYETSLLIAKKIDENLKVENVYIGYGNSEPDLISIASKSGEEKRPLILTQKDYIPQDIYDWLAKQKLANAYFIGGEAVISNKVINKINNITNNNVTGNRIWGNDRYETNGKVIEKFYNKKELNTALVTNVNDHETALMAIPLAVKLKSPLILVDKANLNDVQSEVLNKKFAKKIYRLGSYVENEAFDNVVNGLKFDPLLDGENKGKDALFFVPHQDDEALSFATAIRKALDEGFNVNVILMTDGSSVGVEKPLNGKGGTCRIHKYIHNPKKEGYKIDGGNINNFSINNLVQSRNDEYVRALLKLGVNKNNIHISKFVQKDTQLNKDVAINGMKEFLDKYPNATVHTFYNTNFSKGNHSDHLGLGKAAKELYDNKKISKLYLYVEPYLYRDFVVNCKNEKLYTDYPSTKNQKDSVINSLKEYTIWNPKNGKYAIGYHSVPTSMDSAIKRPVNYFVEYK